MATSARTAPPTFNDMFRASPWLFVDGLVLLSATVIVGAYLFFFQNHREWLWQALGFGWTPVALWAATALFALRYQARMLTYHWRVWAIAATGVAVSICALSYFSPPRGLLEDVSYAGRWGMAMGGPSLFPIGLGKMMIIVAPGPVGLLSAVGRTSLLAGPSSRLALAAARSWLRLPCHERHRLRHQEPL